MVDWEAIETAYRQSDRSVRAIARHFGLSEGAIRKRARQKGWPTRSKQIAGAVQIKVISTGGTQPGTQFRDQYARAHAREGGTQTPSIEINAPECGPEPQRTGPNGAGSQPSTRFREQYTREAQLTPEERKAGWTETDLERYRAERDRAAAQSTVGGLELVGGFVVTEFKRPRPPGPVLEGPRMGSKHYSPHGRWTGSRGGD